MSERARPGKAKKRRNAGKKKKRSTSRRYGPAASKKVAQVMRERKRGTLRSGRSKKKVTNRAQAIAIALSEARKSGAKVPPPRKARKKSR